MCRRGGEILDGKGPTLVAEIGCVHGGSIDRAIDLIRLAGDSGAHAVKSQKRNPHLCVPDIIKGQPHPNPRFSFGSTYLDHRVALELSVESHMAMALECRRLGMLYGCSVWDMDSLKEMTDVQPDFVKIPSACCLNDGLIECALGLGFEVHISNGMTTSDQRKLMYSKLSAVKSRVVVYHTTTEYPCPFSRLYLNEVENIHAMGFVTGFSNHGYGIAADVAAMALGATWIERHFVDDRTYPHTDAAASLEPGGLKTLRRDLDHVWQALRDRPDSMTEEETVQVRKLRK